jgi:hypothetical protein
MLLDIPYLGIINHDMELGLAVAILWKKWWSEWRALP